MSGGKLTEGVKEHKDMADKVRVGGSSGVEEDVSDTVKVAARRPVFL